MVNGVGTRTLSIVFAMLRDWLNSLRFGTRFLIVAMTIIYVIQFMFFDKNIMQKLYFSTMKITNGEVWRMITAPFLHNGILHLMMNMMAFSQLGSSLENRIGTLSFLYHIVLFAILVSLCHCGVALFMLFGGDGSEYVGAALGFSGVLFALIVIDTKLMDVPVRGVFGLFVVPSWMYPWVILFVMQLLLRRVSFWGHLSGIAVGYLYNIGLLAWTVPSVTVFQTVERSLCADATGIGYIQAGGVDGQGWRPFAVFGMRWNEDEEEPAAATGGDDVYRGTGRTIDDV